MAIRLFVQGDEYRGLRGNPAGHDECYETHDSKAPIVSDRQRACRRSSAAVLAAVKAKPRGTRGGLRPALTFAARDGAREGGRDGRMAVPGPNNRMVLKAQT